jgi:hypothetical protein
MALRRRKSSDIPARSRVVVVYAVVDDALSPGFPLGGSPAAARGRRRGRSIFAPGLSGWPGRGSGVNTAQQREKPGERVAGLVRATPEEASGLLFRRW